MSESTSESERAATLLRALKDHPRGDDVARLVQTVAFAAFDERRISFVDGLDEAIEREGLKRKHLETKAGDVRAALRGDDANALLLSVLLMRGLSRSLPDEPSALERIAESLIWLAAHTPVNGLTSVDAVLGDRAKGIWTAVAALVLQVDQGKLPHLGRSGALLGLAMLASSTHSTANAQLVELKTRVNDPVLRTIAQGATSVPNSEISLSGELVSEPRGWILTSLMLISLVLPVCAIARLVGSTVFRYRRPAQVRISSEALVVRTHTELLGRTLRERETHIPLRSLRRAVREVRYPKLLLLTGVFGLALGSFIGVSFWVDGLRAGAPEFLAIGTAAIAVGVVLDFVLGDVLLNTRGRCSVIFVPEKGRALALGRVEGAAAEAALRRLGGAASG